ncbi:MAG: hypothetical protein ABJC09_10550 [Terriglobia bacterium]
MHPILQSWRRFLIWMAAWIPIGAILVLVTCLSGRLPLDQSIAVTTPGALALAFVCLSPWYVCRSLPLRSTSPSKILSQHLASAIILSGGVMLIGRLTASLLGISGFFGAAVPVLAVVVQ